MIKSSTVLLLLLSSQLTFAKSNTETIGDILLVTLPLASYGTTLYLDDKEGQMAFYKSMGTTLGATLALKYSIEEERPDKSDKQSFPSGHTSITVGSATFIHKRYGFKYAIPSYLGAIYTGYSRVHSDKHHTHDVLAGALIGAVSSWYFTDSYGGVALQPVVSDNYQGVKVSYRW